MNFPSLVWFRRDLRLTDNPALCAAATEGSPVIPVYLQGGDEEAGAASNWWLHGSLERLDRDLRSMGSRLTVRRGDPLQQLRALVRETGADTVYWNRRYEPGAFTADAETKQALRGDGLQVHSYNSHLLFEPHTVANGTGAPYRVFTPFWRACQRLGPPDEPGPRPQRLPAPASWPSSLEVDGLRLRPRIDWASGLRRRWEPGEAGALERLDLFCREADATYAENRDLAGRDGTSLLSPHLHFGEIGPRQIWQQLAASRSPGVEPYLRQLGWREFAHHILYHFPHTVDEPLRPEFAAFPYADDAAGERAWQRGRTGYPLVDAGMRQLWETGWMHNRVRMVAASFLVKHLLIDWRRGARWFRDTLVDADLANNTMGWQWTAGCGADAAPYFRIFNPVAQGERFDPDGDYVRRWVPELARLPAKWIHRPWEAPEAVLREAGVEPGVNYPAPLIDHGFARQRALHLYERLRAEHAGRKLETAA